MTILEDLKAGRLGVVPPVSVKPLEWDDAGFAASASVQAFGLTYALQNGRDGWFAAVVGRGISEYLKAEMADLDAAKAAAQADYEARVLSALAASPDHTTALLSLVEGLERERDEARAEAKRASVIQTMRLQGLKPSDTVIELCAKYLGVAQAAEARALAAEARADALREALAALIHNIDTTGGTHGAMSDARRALTQEPNNG